MEQRRERGEQTDKKDRPLGDPPDPSDSAGGATRVIGDERLERGPEDEEHRDEQEGDPNGGDHLERDEAFLQERCACPSVRRRG